MNLGPETYSPSLLEKIVYAGGNTPSFAQASANLGKLADLIVCEEDVRKFTHRVGRELQALRDEAVEEFEDKGKVSGTVPNTPAIAVVMVDGGRALVRADDAGRGVHDAHWREPRYARLMRLAKSSHTEDPRPHAPEAFLDEAHVRALTDEIHSLRPRTQKETAPPKSSPKPDPPAPQDASSKPQIVVETCVASFSSAESFGTMVAAEAARRRFYKAPRSAFLGDGQACNWEIHALHFFEWTPILDFVHLVTYLFAAAQAVRQKSGQSWRLYCKLVRAAWAGEPHHVLATLRKESKRLGEPPDSRDPPEPWKSVLAAIRYVENNAERMDYPRYRVLGFPVTTCHIESLIKRFNFRVKASDKFWVQSGLESVLQVRAAWLSTDTRWEGFWRKRALHVASRSRPYRRRVA